MSYRLALVLFAALAACSPTSTRRESCSNGLDDDGNGLADCADPDCAGQPQCVSGDAGFYGTCVKCGAVCAKQSDCIGPQGWVYEAPVPICPTGICTALNKPVQVRVELDTRNTWAGFQPAPQSVLTRFIRKQGPSGAAVSCATVQAAAQSRLPADVLQIESSGNFIIQGFDVYGLQNPQLGQGINLPYVNVGTGPEYLIWVEFWYGPRDGASKLPTLNRAGWGCFEDSASMPEITAESNCPSGTSDAGACQVFRLQMPGPQ